MSTLLKLKEVIIMRPWPNGVFSLEQSWSRHTIEGNRRSSLLDTFTVSWAEKIERGMREAIDSTVKKRHTSGIDIAPRSNVAAAFSANGVSMGCVAGLFSHLRGLIACVLSLWMGLLRTYSRLPVLPSVCLLLGVCWRWELVNSIDYYSSLDSISYFLWIRLKDLLTLNLLLPWRRFQLFPCLNFSPFKSSSVNRSL